MGLPYFFPGYAELTFHKFKSRYCFSNEFVSFVKRTKNNTPNSREETVKKIKIATTGAAIHGAAKRRVTTTKHFINVINDGTARMSDI